MAPKAQANPFSVLALHEETNPKEAAKLQSKGAQKKLQQKQSQRDRASAAPLRPPPAQHSSPLPAYTPPTPAAPPTPARTYSGGDGDLERAIQLSLREASRSAARFAFTPATTASASSVGSPEADWSFLSSGPAVPPSRQLLQHPASTAYNRTPSAAPSFPSYYSEDAPSPTTQRSQPFYLPAGARASISGSSSSGGGGGGSGADWPFWVDPEVVRQQQQLARQLMSAPAPALRPFTGLPATHGPPVVRGGWAEVAACGISCAPAPRTASAEASPPVSPRQQAAILAEIRAANLRVDAPYSANSRSVYSAATGSVLTAPSPAAQSSWPVLTPSPLPRKGAAAAGSSGRSAAKPLPRRSCPSGAATAAAVVGSTRRGVQALHIARPLSLSGGGDGSEDIQWGDEDLRRVTRQDLEWDLRRDGLHPQQPSLLEDAILDERDAGRAAATAVTLCTQHGDDGRAARALTRADMARMMGHRNEEDEGSGSAGPGGAGTDVFYEVVSLGVQKDYRVLRERMEKNGWVLASSNKHFKFRRVIADGTVQTTMWAGSPSDSQKGIENCMADLARLDRDANAVAAGMREKAAQQLRIQRRLQQH